MMLVTLGASVHAFAQPAPSEGCNIVNGVSYPLLASAILGVPRDFSAGDTIVATVSFPTTIPAPSTVTLEVDKSVVASSSYPGSVRYVFPSAGTFQVDMTLNRGEATWTVTCSQSAAQATAVPTMSIYFLVIASLIIVLLVFRNLGGVNRQRTL
jgi:hypothetical protein